MNSGSWFHSRALFLVCSLSLLLCCSLGGQGTAPKASGQLSGHIYRADTAAPLADTVITAQNTSAPNTPLLTKSAADGSYVFKDIPSGSYHLGAYRSGFVGQYYKIPGRDGCCEPFTVGGGEDHSAIDLSLYPAPHITRALDAALAAAYPKARINFEWARFSPDGTLLAFSVSGIATGDPEQVWLYDLRAQRMIPVTENPLFGRDPGIRDMVWDNGGTLYVEVERRNSGGTHFFLMATMSALREVKQIPPQVVPERAGNRDNPLPAGEGTVEDSKYKISAERRSHGGEDYLMAYPKGGNSFEVAHGGGELRNFFFDAQSSRVVYARFEWSFTGVASMDLTTRRSETLFALQNATGLRLLDRTRNGKVFAYTVYGDCDPDGSKTQWVLLLSKPQPPESPPPQLCFVTLQ